MTRYRLFQVTAVVVLALLGLVSTQRDDTDIDIIYTDDSDTDTDTDTDTDSNAEGNERTLVIPFNEYFLGTTGATASTTTSTPENLVDNGYKDPSRPDIDYDSTPSSSDESEHDASLDCKCVHERLCDPTGSFLTSTAALIDRRLQNDDDVWNVAQCPDSLMRCCKLPPGVTAPPHKTTKPTKQPHCGVRRSSALDSLLRIKDGEDTEFGEFPWMLALLKIQAMPGGGEVNIFECGASLIHPQVALTAAHCIKRASKVDPLVRFRIRAGEWDTQSTDELLPYQDRDVTRVIAHEGYNSGSLFNDVALLVLSRPLDMEDNVDTVCLPETAELYDGRECLATGWGREAFDNESPFNTLLRKVTLVITPAQKCQEELRKTRLGAHFRLNPSFVCAVGRSAGQDTCKGDGGGPLFCPSPLNPGLYTQVGIVSWGVGCGHATPAVYANVVHQRTWIDTKLASLGFAASGATKA